MLQARFAMVTRPVKFFDEDSIAWIMKACIVLHNMIIEDERGHDDLEDTSRFAEEGGAMNEPCVPSHSFDGDSEGRFADFLKRYLEIRDPAVHTKLQNDLITHLWKERGSRVKQ